MINVSDAFRYMIYNGAVSYLTRIKITLEDNTVLNIDNSKLWANGLVIDDSVSTSEDSFDVGTAIINSCTITLNNISGEFDYCDFEYCDINVELGLVLPDGTTEWIQKGVFWDTEASYNGSLITLKATDYMKKFDQAYSLSTLAYPATIKAIIQDACNTCGVELASDTFTNSNFIIYYRPEDSDTMTFREVIMYCMQICCCNARINRFGKLEVKWYDVEKMKLLDGDSLDGGNFTNYNSGDVADGGNFIDYNSGNEYSGGVDYLLANIIGINNIYTMQMSTDDVRITGVRLSSNAKTGLDTEIESVLVGEEGYVLEFPDNAMIAVSHMTPEAATAQLRSVANTIYRRTTGFRFRKGSVTHISNPILEAGDIATVKDGKGHVYPILCSSTRFSIGNSQVTTSNATEIRRASTRYTMASKTNSTIASLKNKVKQGIDDKPGFYFVKEGNDYFICDKSTKANSTNIVKINSSGISLYNGSIQLATFNFGNGTST